MRDYPGNGHALACLREIVASGQGIAFVGAGASAGLYPLWGELIRRLADEAVKRGDATDADRAYWLRNAPTSPQQVVRGIKERLGERAFFALLGDIFGHRTGRDGNPFTPVHRALLTLPFRGYVTTNYDPGLLEARRVCRPRARATGYCTWKDHDPLRAWLTGEVFGEASCPILYAHGTFERGSETIVLGAAEYRQAYKPGLFHELVKKLWGQERLVFVGFGFRDQWFEVVADTALTLIARPASGVPRHVAVLGLPADQPFSQEIRRHFRDAYDAEVLLYPVEEDHRHLLAVLDGLGASAPRPPADQAPARRREAPTLLERWVHDTTEDALYIEPSGALARLDRWADDPQVRVVGVTGIGGLGKTALIGHWLKRGVLRRLAKGLLCLSFNRNRDVTSSFEALCELAAEAGGPAVSGGRDPSPALTALRTVPLVVVLDGLEVLQSSPRSSVPAPRVARDRAPGSRSRRRRAH